MAFPQGVDQAKADAELAPLTWVVLPTEERRYG